MGETDPVLLASLIKIFGYGVATFAFIQGLKNSFPFVASQFLKHPKLGLWLNILSAFALQAVACLQAENTVMVEIGKCFITAIMQALATSGIHAGYKAWLATAAAKASAGAKLLDEVATHVVTISDKDILTPMKEAAGKV